MGKDKDVKKEAKKKPSKTLKEKKEAKRAKKVGEDRRDLIGACERAPAQAICGLPCPPLSGQAVRCDPAEVCRGLRLECPPPTLLARRVWPYLRERGVGTAVYSNYAHRPGIARGLNDWNLGVLAETPRPICFAAFHPEDDDGLAMAAALLDHPRILGFKLQLSCSGFSPTTSGSSPMSS